MLKIYENEILFFFISDLSSLHCKEVSSQIMKFLLFLTLLFYKFDNLTFALYDSQPPSLLSNSLELSSPLLSSSDLNTKDSLHHITSDGEGGGGGGDNSVDGDDLKNGLSLQHHRSIRSSDGDIETRRRVDKNFMRFGRSSGRELMRFGRAGNLMRFGRSDKNLMRFGRAGQNSNLMRFGRAQNNNLMRFGRTPMDNLMRFGKRDKNLMRFGRGNNLMRFGRSSKDNLMRFGRSGYESDTDDLDDVNSNEKIKNFLLMGNSDGTDTPNDCKYKQK